MASNWQKLDDSDPNRVALRGGDILARAFFYISPAGGHPGPQPRPADLKAKKAFYWVMPTDATRPGHLSVWRIYFADSGLQVWRDLAAQPDSVVDTTVPPPGWVTLTNDSTIIEEDDIVTTHPWDPAFEADQPNVYSFLDGRSRYFTAHRIPSNTVVSMGANNWARDDVSLSYLKSKLDRANLRVYRLASGPVNTEVSTPPSAPPVPVPTYTCIYTGSTTIEEGDVLTNRPFDATTMVADQPDVNRFLRGSSDHFTAHDLYTPRADGTPRSAKSNNWAHGGATLSECRSRLAISALTIYRKVVGATVSADTVANSVPPSSAAPSSPSTISAHQWVCLSNQVASSYITIQNGDILAKGSATFPTSEAIPEQNSDEAFFHGEALYLTCSRLSQPVTLKEARESTPISDLALWRDYGYEGAGYTAVSTSTLAEAAHPPVRPVASPTTPQYQWTKLPDSTAADLEAPLHYGDVICAPGFTPMYGYSLSPQPIRGDFESGRAWYFTIDESWQFPDLRLVRVLCKMPTLVAYRDMCLATVAMAMGGLGDSTEAPSPTAPIPKPKPYQWTRLDDRWVGNVDMLPLYSGDVVCRAAMGGLTVGYPVHPQSDDIAFKRKRDGIQHWVLQGSFTLGYIRKWANDPTITAWRDIGASPTPSRKSSTSSKQRIGGVVTTFSADWGTTSWDDTPKLFSSERPKGMDRCRGNAVFADPLPLP